MNTRQTGNVYEQMAADYLEKQGMRILERNFRRGRNGEIDIIGRDGKYLAVSYTHLTLPTICSV